MSPWRGCCSSTLDARLLQGNQETLEGESVYVVRLFMSPTRESRERGGGERGKGRERERERERLTLSHL